MGGIRAVVSWRSLIYIRAGPYSLHYRLSAASCRISHGTRHPTGAGTLLCLNHPQTIPYSTNPQKKTVFQETGPWSQKGRGLWPWGTTDFLTRSSFQRLCASLGLVYGPFSPSSRPATTIWVLLEPTSVWACVCRHMCCLDHSQGRLSTMKES